MFCNEWGVRFFSPVRLPIISQGGLPASGAGSVTVRAAAASRAPYFGRCARTNRPDPQGSLLPFSSLGHQASNMKLNASGRQVRAASDGALLPTASVEQPDAALPHVAVRGSGRRRGGDETRPGCGRNQTGAFIARMPLSVGNADKQAQESMTGCYIRCNAAEPHDSVAVEGLCGPPGRKCTILSSFLRLIAVQAARLYLIIRGNTAGLCLILWKMMDWFAQRRLKHAWAILEAVYLYCVIGPVL